MGKPRLIILIRHAQSTGNENRAVHQTVPDHRVPLTPHGHSQALAAGTKLSTLLLPDDTVQIVTSPYTRTRETTQGILRSSSLQSHPNYSTIRIHEEPRLREQDFGNFQPCAAEMKRHMHERAAYGHFFYRIPNGESAADAYDRVAGFNESLWRQFAEEDFPSVLVLVTHGLMTRIFLMKWYHYSVEYFEDLRNVEHCEFVVMERDDSLEGEKVGRGGKFVLRTPLRTWSGDTGGFNREREMERYKNPPTPPVVAGGVEGEVVWEMGEVTWKGKRFGPCAGGCSHSEEGLMEREEVVRAGRDFGGSRSGVGSRNASDDEGEVKECEAKDPDGKRQSREPADVMENWIRAERAEFRGLRK